MVYLVFVIISIVLLCGFSVLVWYESRIGKRYLEHSRERLDKQVERVEFIATHVDFNSFAREEAVRVASRVGHDIAHFSLQTVRAAERLLTRLVRHFRTQHEVEVRPAGETREFVKTLTDFKDRLKDTMPDVPEV